MVSYIHNLDRLYIYKMIYIFIWKLCCRKEKVVQLIQRNKRNSETRYEGAFYHHQQELNWIKELNLLDWEVERKAAWYLVKQNAGVGPQPQGKPRGRTWSKRSKIKSTSQDCNHRASRVNVLGTHPPCFSPFALLLPGTCLYLQSSVHTL